MKTLFLLTAFLFLCRPALHAQEMFLACDSLAIAGKHLLQTPDGGFLVQTYSTAEHAFHEPGFALIKLDATGSAEWGRLYPATVKNNRGVFSPSQFLPDKEGNILVVGSAATNPFDHVPAIALFTPHGIPTWSRIVSEREGRITDVERFPNNHLITCGELYQPEMLGRGEEMKPFFAGSIVAGLSSEGETFWIKGIQSAEGEGVTGIHLFRHGSTVSAVGTINVEGCCVDNPMFLLNIADDGSVIHSEFLVVRSPQNARTYFTLTPQECITTESHTLICGQLLKYTALPNDDLTSMPSDFESTFSSFVLKLDDKNNILWSRSITAQEELTGPFRMTVTTGEEIIITSIDEDESPVIVRLDSAGSLLSTSQLAEGINKRFDDYREEQEPSHAPLDYCTITALTPTVDGGIAGLCAIDVSAAGSEELEEQGYFPHYSAGIFRLSPSLMPQCVHPKRAPITVESLQLIREPFQVRMVDLATSPSQKSARISGGNSISITLKPVDYKPEVKELCTNGLVEASNQRDQQREAGVNLILSPNTVLSGKSLQLEYDAGSDNASPSVITILNASSGRVHKTLSGNDPHDNSASGRCTYMLSTTGLIPGIYLVRVKVGNREETAKLYIE